MPVKEKKKKKKKKQTYKVVAIKRWWKHKLLLRHWQRYDKVTCHGGAGSIVPLHSLVVKLSFLFFPSLQGGVWFIISNNNFQFLNTHTKRT